MTIFKLNAKDSIDGIKWTEQAVKAAVNYQCPAWPTHGRDKVDLRTALDGFDWECENQAAARGSKVVELRDVEVATGGMEVQARESMGMSPGRPMKLPRSEFESRIRDIMFDAGINSYSELATRAGLTIATIQRICMAPESPSYRRAGIATLQAIASALNCKIDDLIQPTK